MALGTLGSTLNDELNRLANGGTYRDKDDMVDEALAAKQWANRENINPYSTDTVGVLNEIAGLGTNRQNWLDFNGVCNYIAGTTGLPAAAALRQVYPTTDLLTGVASYYIDATDASASTQTVTNLGAAGSLLPTTLGSSTAADSNDPKFLDFTGTNYVYLPGVASNYLSVPNAAPLQITGDIDLRARVALDDWTPAAATQLVSKYGGGGNVGYAMRLDTDGKLRFQWSADGTALNNSVSTVATGIADGATKWVRATMDVDNGASGNNVQFFTSDDGTSWTQLGSTVTTAGTTSLFASTQQVEIGSRNGGNDPAAAKVFRAQIFNGIDGTKVLDVDTSVITAGSATSFTAVTGQTVTINRSTSGRKTVAVTQPTWLFGTDDSMEVNNRYMSSGTYLCLPGVASNNCTTPDAAALDITGDLDIRVKVAMDDWTPSANQYLIAKLQTQRSYGLQLNSDGRLVFVRSTDGSATTSVFSGVSTVPFADGATGWVRVTFDVDNGAGGNDTIFYTSTDGTTWTQLGTTQTNAGTTATFNSNASLEIGSGFAGVAGPARGKFFRAQVRNGIDGTVAFDANFETSITSLLQASFTESSVNAATVTINRSGSSYRSAGITEAGYLYPGATNTFSASATDFLNFGASQDFTILWAGRTWNTQNAFRDYIGKTTAVGGIGSWTLESNNNTLSTQFWITSTGVAGGTTTTARSNGQIAILAGVANRTTNRFFVNQNNVPNAEGSLVGVGTLENFGTVRMGVDGGGYQDFEAYAAAVFRQALTASQIRQIYNYFINREVYL